MGLKTVSDEQWFIQRLDHFSADSREWKQASISLSLKLLKCTLKIKSHVERDPLRHASKANLLSTCLDFLVFLFLFLTRGTF